MSIPDIEIYTVKKSIEVNGEIRVDCEKNQTLFLKFQNWLRVRCGRDWQEPPVVKEPADGGDDAVHHGARQ